MIRSQETLLRRAAENLFPDAADPLVLMAHQMRLKKGKETLLDMDQPAFVRRILKLGVPICKLGSQKEDIPARIGKLLNVVLGQNGVLFPVKET